MMTSASAKTVLGAAGLTVDHLHAEVAALQRHRHRFDSSLPRRGTQLEHAGTYRRHLRASFGAHARGEHAAGHRRTNLVQKGVEATAAPLPRRHDEVGAVGGEPGVEHRRHPRGQVAPGRGRPEQDRRRAASRGELGDDPGVRLGAIVSERLIVGDENDVDAVTNQLIDGGAELVAGNDGTDPAAEGRGQVGGLRQQLERRPGRPAVVQLTHHPHARITEHRPRRRNVAGRSRLVAGSGAVGWGGESPDVGESTHERRHR